MSASAFLFDCDGLLVDSERIWLDLIADVAAARGVRIDASEYTGLTSGDTAVRLAALFGGNPAELDAELTRSYRIRLSGNVPAMPGAREFLGTHHHAVPLAVVSNGLRIDVEHLLAMTGLAEHVSMLVTADDVSHPKPHPEPYVLAATQLGVDIRDCVVFEDSLPGCEAGQAAGAYVVGVQSSDIVLPCDLRIRSFLEIQGARFPLGFPAPAPAPILR